jgi:Rrf2 family protein
MKNDEYICLLIVEMVSKTFGYALRAAAYVVSQSEGKAYVSLQEIAEELDIPRHFLGKIMQDLVRHGILHSSKGPHGGFTAHAGSRSISLTRIYTLTDGDALTGQCLLGLRACNALSPCPLHDEFSRCRRSLLDAMQSQTLGGLAERVAAREVHLCSADASLF